MYELPKTLPTDKAELYRILNSQLSSLLEDERDFIANSANLISLIYHTLPDLNWAGVYIYKGGELVLGPFQGKPACVRIALGKGVCGKAAKDRVTVVVKNVHEFPGHIACDAASNSEIVIPIIYESPLEGGSGRCLIGILDLDSPLIGRFDTEDQAGLETLVKTFITLTEFNFTETIRRGLLC